MWRSSFSLAKGVGVRFSFINGFYAMLFSGYGNDLLSTVVTCKAFIVVQAHLIYHNCAIGTKSPFHFRSRQAPVPVFAGNIIKRRHH